ncbi:hypothetical protein ACFSHT_31055 [Paraburkholderia silviterrae]|uniref:Uncharacterized protein n=1 Tax=Paraburkholderia silviterrae TaxID=2528715 RepID=A0A4R5M3P8_9BURK|nr:hypothetical protein [Paraburkholderia silviterrae]TDG20264.1 hypothetical protein EYW47_27640 [Paraburkholderia silviterrae]
MSGGQNTEDNDFHKVGPYILKKVRPGPTTAGIEPTYALCTPDRWGMRYSDADPERRAQLMYPVARDYAKAMQAVLLNQIQWGDAWFGPAGAAPALKLKWPIGETQTIQLFKLLTPVMTDALTSHTGGFGIPADVVPPIAAYTPGNSSEHGAFAPSSWLMLLNLSTLEPLFRIGNAAKPSDPVTRNAQLKQLREFADTIYHESRHCQQNFWVFALVQQFPGNFEEIPNIAKWPAVMAISGDRSPSSLQRIVSLAASSPLPTETAPLISLKRMAVGLYLSTLNLWRKAGYCPPYAPDKIAMEAEYQRARTAARDLLQHVGLGGTAIDVDAMVEEPNRCRVDYTARPWENDAFFCGEMATNYWNAGLGLLLKTYPEDRCSSAYELAYAASKLTGSHGNPAGSTSGGQ